MRGRLAASRIARAGLRDTGADTSDPSLLDSAIADVRGHRATCETRGGRA
jgi:hypothetical protein